MGQPNFTSAFELPYNAQGPHQLRFPYSVDSSDGMLAVADTANNRVLFWEAGESSIATDATDLIGQPDFASNGENQWLSISKETLCWPYGVCFHNGKLAVADSGNNRVTLWNCRETASPTH